MEEESDAEILKRISGPVVWSEIDELGIRIQDVTEDRYQEILNLIQGIHIKEDVLTRCSGILTDNVALNTYMDRIVSYMNDATSLMAIDNKSNKIVGVAINKVMRNSEHTLAQSQVKLADGEGVHKIVKICSTLIKNGNIYEKYEIDAFLRNYILTVTPRFKKSDLKVHLMRTSILLARYLEMGAFAGIFSLRTVQNMAKSLGLEVISEISYINWKVHKKMVFSDPGPGNYTLAFMGIKTEPFEPEKSGILASLNVQ